MWTSVSSFFLASVSSFVRMVSPEMSNEYAIPGLHGTGPHRLPFQPSLPDDCPVLHPCRFISMRPAPRTVIKTICLHFMSRPPPPPEASLCSCFHALRILCLPTQASVTSITIDSSPCDLLHRRLPKEFKMPLIQHHRPPLQFQGSPQRPPLDYKVASQMRRLHTAPPPITIRHPQRLIHQKDSHGQAATSNTRHRTSYAYNFGFKPVPVSSPKSSAPSPLASGEMSCRSRPVKGNRDPALPISCPVHGEWDGLGSYDLGTRLRHYAKMSLRLKKNHFQLCSSQKHKII
jgi:hypothetical protein